MEEDALKASIDTYKLQLEQVKQAIQAAGETEDLVKLQRDLKELIQLSEESLLSLKKSQLLKELDSGEDDGTGSTQLQSEASTTMDDEYAAFQAILGDDLTASEPHQSPATSSNTDSSTIPDMSEIYKDIVGTKCLAPFVQEWGAKLYGNAMIAGVQTDSDMEMPKVCVMFCNPTNLSMLPCRFFLEGSCKFTEDKCRYSHGYKVELGDLQEYREPDYSLLKIESRCLARYDDDLWYKATVVDLHDDQVSVTFDSYSDEVMTLTLEDIWPLEHTDDETDNDNKDSDDEVDVKNGSAISREDSDEDEEALPVYLWKESSHGLGDLGQWEAHTRGIGSRLMSMMGYEPGKGLGRSGEGRVEPVPIQLLPQGKSLDVIMKLKEIAGERSMFDVVKKLEKKKKKQTEKLAADYKKIAEKPSVFDFINKKLRGKKGKLSELIHKHEGQGQTKASISKVHQTISEHDLTKKTDRNINIQLLKTGEEIKSVQKELTKLKQSLSRNETRDRAMATQVRQKIQSMESYLDKLRSSEATMASHQQKRTNHKKLTVF